MSVHLPLRWCSVFSNLPSPLAARLQPALIGCFTTTNQSRRVGACQRESRNAAGQLTEEPVYRPNELSRSSDVVSPWQGEPVQGELFKDAVSPLNLRY